MSFDLSHAQKPSIFRRIAAFLYDLLLLIAVLMVAVGLVVVPYGVITGEELHKHHLLLERIYLLLVACGFYVYFWTHGGQTLGMKAWRLKVIAQDGTAVSFNAAVKRFFWSILSLLPAGLGLWWSLFNRQGLAWHDSKSNTRVVLLPKDA
ncbi:RDD family protein [Thermochromatium tepidum]|uniref:RDD family protein n=1 Tax=Thermochromatium tepidum ATCC 43061 TaxID=316276 RepID=A0A6I6E5A2_THETI|nr:RDD family protein [Thermochromatium tepidum]QGU33012.1 RDD family protein [Thermochromatium tepidum ATCC 43061]